jgi:Putative peptidoglycan binding domain
MGVEETVRGAGAGQAGGARADETAHDDGAVGDGQASRTTLFARSASAPVAAGHGGPAEQAVTYPANPRGRSPNDTGRRPRARMLVAGLLVLAAAAVALIVADPFESSPSASGVADNASPTALHLVERRSLSSQQSENGTLGYAGSYSIVNQAQGTVTALPSVGEVIGLGHVLYRVSGAPVVLLYGHTPAYRTLAEKLQGADVRELNTDLVALGYASGEALDPSSEYFGAETKYALERLQAALREKETGKLVLGQAVFLPGPLRIVKVLATLGAPAPPGNPIAQASSTKRQVVIDLNAASQSGVKVGDRVTIALPSGVTTPGYVSSVGTVASSHNEGGHGEEGSPTIEVDITPTDPHATGGLDQAPVQVSIATASVSGALVVPVDALLALAGGGYAVEVVEGRLHRLLAVTPGLFDDAEGLVQVSGAGLRAGQSVVVPST